MFMGGDMFRIGEFAKRVNCSVRTLRYYSDIGLLIPAKIDLFTGYRYYDDSQIDDYYLIIKYKNLGFSLDEIRDNWGNFNEDVLFSKREELLESKKNIDFQIKQLDEMRMNLSSNKLLKKERN